MPDNTSFASLLLALFLPWLVGAVSVRGLLAGSSGASTYVIVGHGYFAGIFLVTLIMRLFDAIGLPITFYTVAIGTATCSLPAFWRMRVTDTSPTPAVRERLGGWTWIVISLLLALVALRYYTLAAEVLARPLFAWDAWMNWAPKAVVWFHHGEIVPFVTQDEWLATTDLPVYTLGNLSASTYPHTLPLLYWWMMMAADSTASSTILLPWVLAPLALCSALYGHLRASNVTPSLAAIAVYALANMPFINVHSALAGYADLWMAAAFSLAILSTAARSYTGNAGWTLLCLFWCLMCITLKQPGIIFGGIAGVALVTATLNISRKLAFCAFFLAAICLLLAFYIGINIDIPRIGLFRLDQDGIELPGLGSHWFSRADIMHPTVAGLFGMINWNLLFYLVLAALLTTALMPRNTNENNTPVLIGTLLATGFLICIFSFTEYSHSLTFSVTFNRTIIYLIPAIIYLLANSVQLRLNS
ncbi:hypothetical protein N9052_01365 [bacterium]|nr:hypothetical protein [bacterium]